MRPLWGQRQELKDLRADRQKGTQEEEEGSPSPPWRSARSRPDTHFSRVIQIRTSSGCHSQNSHLPQSMAHYGILLSGTKCCRIACAWFLLPHTPRLALCRMTTLLSHLLLALAPKMELVRRSLSTCHVVSVTVSTPEPPTPSRRISLSSRRYTWPPNATTVTCVTKPFVIWRRFVAHFFA